jgi:CelD/BcsL family acetyltransferase involved in cellulose biosynthesis
MSDNKEIIVREARHINELEKYEKSWDQLLKKCPESTPTQTFAWLHAFFKYKLSSDTKWICLFAFNNDGELLGVYPLIILRRLGIAGLTIQFFKIPHDPYHTVRADGLIRPDSKNILKLFLEFLKRRFKAYPTIKIQKIPLISPTLRYLENTNSALFHYKKLITFEDYVNTHGEYKEFLQSLNSKFRRELKRQERRLNENVKLFLKLDEKERSNEENLYHFAELENSGWKAEKGMTIKLHKGDNQLFASATERFHKHGWMRWHFLEADNEIIGALLNVKINNIDYYWRIAYNENFSYGSPGHLIVSRLLEKAFGEEDSSEINFMNQRKWLKVWNVQKRELFDIVIFPQIRIFALIGKLILKFQYYRKPPKPHVLN